MAWYPSVANTWAPWIRRWEGVTKWMYLDVKGKVTTGIGKLIDSISAAQQLPWLVKGTNRLATQAEIADEWRRVKALTKWQKLNGLNRVWSDSARLVLTDAAVDRLLVATTGAFYVRLRETVTFLDRVPAPAQLALLDLAYQNGPAFLDSKEDDGTWTWKNMRPAVLSQNWAAAAAAVPGSGDRAKARALLFRNAAAVVRTGADPAVLWYPDPPPEKQKGYDMAVAVPLYKTNGVDQSIAAEKETTLRIEPEKGNTSIVIGENDGVDVEVIVGFDTTGPTNVSLWLALADARESDGGDAKLQPGRLHGKLQFEKGAGWEIKASYKGSIPANKADGRDYRLRAVIWANQPITVTITQYHGWRMP